MSLRARIIRLALGRDTAEDWQSGDLALCIDTRPWIDLGNGCEAPGPTNGDMLRVAGIKIAYGALFLKFADWPEWFTAKSFRKVRPNQTEACDRSFIRMMKRLRPMVDA